MKVEEQDLLDRIDRALEHEFVNESGVIIINVENGYIKQILMDLEEKEGMSMNKDQQDRLWNELSEDYKEDHRHFYKTYKDFAEETNFYTICRQMEKTFGCHNLNPEPPTSKTWEDVEKDSKYQQDLITTMETNDGYYAMAILQTAFSKKIYRKILATAKITKLIELGYGGMVSEEEIDNILPLWIIRCDYKGKVFVESYKGVVIDKLLTFRTRELAEEFMSHESNRKLVEMYYLM